MQLIVNFAWLWESADYASVSSKCDLEESPLTCHEKGISKENNIYLINADLFFKGSMGNISQFHRWIPGKLT